MMCTVSLHGEALARKAKERHRYEMRRDSTLAGLAGPTLVLPSGGGALLLEDGTIATYEVVAVTGYRCYPVSRNYPMAVDAVFNALDEFDRAVRAAQPKPDLNLGMSLAAE